MNTRMKSTVILMALIITISTFTSLAATTAVAAATTQTVAATTAVATTTAMPTAAVNSTPSVVAATPTTTTITASNNYPPVGSAVALTVSVKAGTTVVHNAQVTVTHTYPGSTTPATDGVFNTGSTGLWTFSSGTYGSAGQRVYTAAFAGDGTYAASSGTLTVLVLPIPRHSTTTTITASNTNPTVGSTVTITVNLKSGTTGLSAPIKLWYTYNGGPRIDRPGTFSTTNGVYVFSGPFGHTGTYVYHAEFAGDSQYAASAGTVTVNVQPKVTTTTTIIASNRYPRVGEVVTLSITVKAGGTVLPNRQVRIGHTTPDGNFYWDGPNNGWFNTGPSGVVAFQSGAFSSAGPSVYTATFAGDSLNAPSSGTVTVNVGTTKDNTNTMFTTSNVFPSVGSAITLTINVAKWPYVLPPVIPNQQVRIGHTTPDGNFYWDGPNNGWFNTGPSGVVAFQSGAFSSAGPRVYTATFAGDSQNAPSSSTIMVNVGGTPTKTSTTTITASNTSPKVGSAVTLTVSVASPPHTVFSTYVTVTHTNPGSTQPVLDGIFVTDVKYSAGPYGSAGPRVYTAVWGGYDPWAASSSTVTVNVQSS